MNYQIRHDNDISATVLQHHCDRSVTNAKQIDVVEIFKTTVFLNILYYGHIKKAKRQSVKKSWDLDANAIKN